jgi:outer membrane receptor protein involved in Fe transport
MSYRFDEDRRGPLSGTALSLSVRNLFDRAPPAVPTDAVFRMAGYDAANASPMLRFVAVEISKRF